MQADGEVAGVNRVEGFDIGDGGGLPRSQSDSAQKLRGVREEGLLREFTREDLDPAVAAAMPMKRGGAVGSPEDTDNFEVLAAVEDLSLPQALSWDDQISQVRKFKPCHGIIDSFEEVVLGKKRRHHIDSLYSCFLVTGLDASFIKRSWREREGCMALTGVIPRPSLIFFERSRE